MKKHSKGNLMKIVILSAVMIPLVYSGIAFADSNTNSSGNTNCSGQSNSCGSGFNTPTLKNKQFHELH